MKKLIYLLSLLCCLATAGQAMAYSVTLTPNAQTIVVGSAALVDVNLLFTPGEELFGFNFAVNFDPAILRFDNLLFTNLPANYVAGFSSPTDLGTPGLVTFDGGLFSLPPGATADIMQLATMSYTGIGAGLSQLNLSGSVLDNITLLETQVGASGSIDSFDSVPPVPEPGTFLLLGVGLTGLIAFRRKFHKA